MNQQWDFISHLEEMREDYWREHGYSPQYLYLTDWWYESLEEEAVKIEPEAKEKEICTFMGFEIKRLGPTLQGQHSRGEFLFMSNDGQYPFGTGPIRSD